MKIKQKRPNVGAFVSFLSICFSLLLLISCSEDYLIVEKFNSGLFRETFLPEDSLKPNTTYCHYDRKLTRLEGSAPIPFLKSIRTDAELLEGAEYVIDEKGEYATKTEVVREIDFQLSGDEILQIEKQYDLKKGLLDRRSALKLSLRAVDDEYALYYAGMEFDLGKKNSFVLEFYAVAKKNKGDKLFEIIGRYVKYKRNKKE